MQKKLLALVGGSILFIMVLTGCGTNQQPPPDEDVNIEEPSNGTNVTPNGTNGTNNGTTNDLNTDNDGDIMKDRNTPAEDIIEDKHDMNDKDNMDR